MQSQLTRSYPGAMTKPLPPLSAVTPAVSVPIYNLTTLALPAASSRSTTSRTSTRVTGTGARNATTPASTATRSTDRTSLVTRTATMMVRECPSCPAVPTTVRTAVPYVAPAAATGFNATAAQPIGTDSAARPTAVAGPSAPFTPMMAGSGASLTTSMGGIVVACLVALAVL